MVNQNLNQVGQSVDMVAQTGSLYTSSPVGGKDDGNLTMLMETQGKILYLWY